MANHQPRAQNYNEVRVLWTDEETEYLIDQRMYRNEEFWGLSSTDHMKFWESIRTKINECFGTKFTAVQIKIKWKNLVKEHTVSIKFIIKIYTLYNIYYINIFNIFLRIKQPSDYRIKKDIIREMGEDIMRHLKRELGESQVICLYELYLHLSSKSFIFIKTNNSNDYN